MILAIAVASIKTPTFNDAMRRTMRFRKILQSRLKPIEIHGRYNLLGLVIGDYRLNTFRVNRKATIDMYQVFVGYDLDEVYTDDRDESIIALMAGWVRRAFVEAAGYSAKRAELLDIVNSWEAESVASIVGQRRIGRKENDPVV